MSNNYRPYFSRRQFIGSVAAASIPLLSFGKTEPETILYNGNIYTVNPKEPAAQAVAIAAGRLMAVGSNSDILKMATARTKKVDLGQKTVLPGFIDAHTHPAAAGMMHLKMVDCDLRSIKDIKDAIRQRASVTPKGNWVEGFKYDDTKTGEGRKINMADLDEAAPDHPVRISHRGGHTTYCNSLAFKMAGIAESTPNPKGGEFERSPDGKLTGCVKESANDFIDKLIPNILTRDEKREGVKLISKMMSKTGITSATDALGSPEYLQAYQDAYEAGELGIRIYCMIYYTSIDNMIAAGVRTGMGNDWVKIGGLKMTCDGSISERTARLSQPYIGRPNDYGIIVMDEEKMYPYAKKAYDAGIQHIETTLIIICKGQLSYTHFPPVIVRSIGMVISVDGSSLKGFRPNTTRSASLPASREPLLFSSKDAYAPLMVPILMASSTVTF